jgi:predicted secreted protein
MALAGYAGSAKSGANAINITGWTLDISVDMLESHSMGDAWKEFIAGLKEWSGSLEGDYAVPSDTNGQAAVQTAFFAGNTVSLSLYVDATHYYSGTALISSMSVGAQVDDKISISFDFQGSGALTYT